MSRVAKYPISVPTEVTVELDKHQIIFKGSRGVLSHRLPKEVVVHFEAPNLKVVPLSSSRQARSLAGTLRTNLWNQVSGVFNGFKCVLNLVGVGYRAQIQDKYLVLNVGCSQPKRYAIPKNVTIEVPGATEIIVKGPDIQQVHQVAAEIRKFRPPKVYQGTGIRLAHEKIILKEIKKK
jgi:large subunit ribosomal protein L6